MKIKTHSISRRECCQKIAATVIASTAAIITNQSRNAQAFESASFDIMKPLNLRGSSVPIVNAAGVETSLNEIATRPLLVNFWASWCPPCIHELPSLEKLDNALSDFGMAVMLVGIDREGHTHGQEFLKNRGINIDRTTYDESGKLTNALKIRAMPTSFLVRAGGHIIGKIEGPMDWHRPKTIQDVALTLATAT